MFTFREMNNWLKMKCSHVYFLEMSEKKPTVYMIFIVLFLVVRNCTVSNSGGTHNFYTFSREKERENKAALWWWLIWMCFLTHINEHNGVINRQLNLWRNVDGQFCEQEEDDVRKCHLSQVNHSPVMNLPSMISLRDPEELCFIPWCSHVQTQV